jgi:hypothetical protein
MASITPVISVPLDQIACASTSAGANHGAFPSADQSATN